MQYYPLTPAQQRIFDLHRFVPQATVIAGTAWFDETLSEASAQASLNFIVETNDALRLCITPQGRQYIAPHTPQTFAVRHFATQQAMESWAAQQAQQPMDLHEQLYEFTVVTVGENRCGALLRLHHIICDAWTLSRCANLLYLYYYNPQHVESPSFVRHIEKQQAYLQSSAYARDKAYWLQLFANWPSPVLLAKQATADFTAARHEVHLTPVQATPLREFAAAHKLSLFNLFTTAMGVYLYRMRGQQEVCLGTTTLGRKGAVDKQTMGMFAGTVPLGMQFNPQAGFLTAAHVGQEVLFGAVRHEGFGYPELLRALNKPRLYDVVVNYYNAAWTGMEGNLKNSRLYTSGAQVETLQLHVSDVDNTGGLTLAYDYLLAEFTQQDVQRLHARLMTLLTNAMQSPETAIAALDLLCDEDKAAWAQLNQTKHEIEAKTVLDCVEKQVCATPEAIAVCCGDESLTYAQLDEWATSIANEIDESGQVVPVQLPRCLELMPRLLGIWKAGCAYLPILPDYPPERVAFMREQVRELDGTDLAYVMYTSGSTGRPKAVRVTHAGLANRLLWQQANYPLQSGEIVLQKTSLAFDVSAWELWMPLMSGATLCLPEPNAEKDPRRLTKLMREYRVRTVHFVPSMLAVWLNSLQGELPPLEQVICSGEALTPALVARFYEIFAATDARLINFYGPTECTVDVLHYACKAGDNEIPIGRPVWNTIAQVCDENDQPLPPGERGELVIGGAQVAQRLPQPYRTGDVCSLRADGQILYHGRGDDQVKIRGQRVALGEIEREMEQLPGVARAAVKFDERLWGYVIAEQFDEQAALHMLQQRLPVHMLPEKIVQIAEFPLSANGKLERAALPVIAVQTSDHLQPVTAQEIALMAAVHSMLGRTPSLDEPPARCGLSSLDIVSLTLTLEQQGMLLRVADFYTAADFAALAKLAERAEESPSVVQLAGGEITIPTKPAIVAIPYGGGGFGAWADVARKVDLPFYAARTAHVNPQEIAMQLPQGRIVVAGSCVGAGLAIALAQQLGERCVGLVLVASTPPPLARIYGRWLRPWTLRGHAGTNRALQKLSARPLQLGQREIAQLQADARHFLRVLAKNRRVNIAAPITLVYGEDDPALRHARARNRWAKLFGKDVREVAVAGARHDVIHTHAKEVACLFLK